MPFQEETQECGLPFLLSATLRHNGNMAIYKPGRGPSPRTKTASALILELPASATVRNKCLLLQTPRLQSFGTAVYADICLVCKAKTQMVGRQKKLKFIKIERSINNLF